MLLGGIKLCLNNNVKKDPLKKVAHGTSHKGQKVIIPIDLIVYTKPMYNKFNELGSLFSKEISQKGIVLYESDN